MDTSNQKNSYTLMIKIINMNYGGMPLLRTIEPSFCRLPQGKYLVKYQAETIRVTKMKHMVINLT